MKLRKHCEDLENRLHIGLGRSTLALMVADPLDVLEEDEIHLGFDSAFTDPKSQFSDTMLHDMDVLVARDPALLPSDIQRVGTTSVVKNRIVTERWQVKAVFKPELAGYKNVIVFPSKGRMSLADKLSG